MSHDDRNRPRWPSDPKQSRSSTKPELSGLPVRPHPHLTPHRVALALQADFAPADWRQLTTHCPACKEAAATLESWSRMLDHPDLYVACEQASVPALLQEVLALEQPGRLELIETHGEFRSWGLCCELIHLDLEAHDSQAARIHAQEMIEVLQDDRVRGPAAQALVRFARLAKTQDPEISLVEHLHEYLAQARRNPELEWQPETPTESTSSA